MDSKKLGILGERVAEKYLLGKGYKILEKNYYKKLSNVSKGEIDIIAKKDGVISFIEVKAAVVVPEGTPEGTPEDFLPEDRFNFKKQKQLIKLSQIWLLEHRIPLDSKWQIDVIGISIDINSKKAKIRHFKNAVEDFY